MLKILWDDDTVPAMKRERNLPAVLSRDEINAIIDATPNLKHKAIIATMYSSGLRVSEVVHLHYDDISRTNMTIHVRETKFVCMSEFHPLISYIVEKTPMLTN